MTERVPPGPEDKDDVLATAPSEVELLDATAAVLPVLREHAAEVDERAAFPIESIAALHSHGLMGCLVPGAYGGAGIGLKTFVAIAQQLAGACLTTASIWAMHCQQVDALVRHGRPELTSAVLPRIVAGDLYLASVTTEQGKGGHLLTARTPAQREGESLRFERLAPVVTGGAHAGGFLVTLRAGQETAEEQVSLVYADRSQLDVQSSGGWHTLGMRGTESGGLRLAGEVPDHQVVGGHGGFRKVAVDSYIPMAHLGWAACWLGTARGAFADLIAHLRTPGRRGGPDVSSELVRERLARIRVDLELVHGYLQRVTQEVEELRERGAVTDSPAQQIHLNTLKLVASELSHRAVDRMVELAGLSLGYAKDSPIPLERHLRDLRSASLNYSNERLWAATGALTLVDRAVTLG